MKTIYSFFFLFEFFFSFFVASDAVGPLFWLKVRTAFWLAEIFGFVDVARNAFRVCAPLFVPWRACGLIAKPPSRRQTVIERKVFSFHFIRIVRRLGICLLGTRLPRGQSCFYFVPTNFTLLSIQIEYWNRKCPSLSLLRIGTRKWVEMRSFTKVECVKC